MEVEGEVQRRTVLLNAIKAMAHSAKEEHKMEQGNEKMIRVTSGGQTVSKHRLAFERQERFIHFV
jgi:hypothetical protein